MPDLPRVKTAFAGIPADGFAFLRELAAEQNKPWFEANKARYEAALRAPCAALVEALSAGCAARDIPLVGDKRSMFRIHRDVRFSKDKSPYKTHAGMLLLRPGAAKAPHGALYVHVAPADSFAAVACYLPEPPVLEAVRAAIRRREQTWLGIEQGLAGQGFHFEAGDPLTRMPRGYEDAADTLVAAALRRRSHLIRMKLTQRALGGPAVVEAILDFVVVTLPFLRFVWRAMDEAAEVAPASRISRFLPGA